MQKLFVNWLNNFYSEHPITFRIFWFLVGWFFTSAVIMQVQKKRQVIRNFSLEGNYLQFPLRGEIFCVLLSLLG